MPLKSPVRRFTILDAIIVVAAVALGLALTKSLIPLQWMVFNSAIKVEGQQVMFHKWEMVSLGMRPVADPFARRVAVLAQWGHLAAYWPGPSVAALSIAVFVTTLIRPRPPIKRLLRRPGAAAMLATIAAVAVVSLLSLQAQSYPQGASPAPGGVTLPMWRYRWFGGSVLLPSVAGYTVLVVWMTLYLSGRWAADRGWPDRAGRVLGACWIGMALVGFVASCLLVFG